MSCSTSTVGFAITYSILTVAIRGCNEPDTSRGWCSDCSTTQWLVVFPGNSRFDISMKFCESLLFNFPQNEVTVIITVIAIKIYDLLLNSINYQLNKNLWSIDNQSIHSIGRKTVFSLLHVNIRFDKTFHAENTKRIDSYIGWLKN